MTKVQELQQYLKDNKLAISGITIHPDAEPQAEKMAEAILDSLKEIAAGNYEELE